MNLSSSFDHRFVDGYDAAAMIQALKEMLEHPATIFIQESDGPGTHERNSATLRTRRTSTTNPRRRPAFGTVLAEQMSSRALTRTARWSATRVRASRADPMHPASHVLHYGSTCFEGQGLPLGRRQHQRLPHGPAHRAHAEERASCSSCRSRTPTQLAAMVTRHRRVRGRCPSTRRAVPAPDAVRHRRLDRRGVAPATEATLIVLASPVWDYFAKGEKPLRIYVEEKPTRTASHLGMVKAGGNYAAAMGPTLAARRSTRPTRSFSARAALCRRPAPRTSC